MNTDFKALHMQKKVILAALLVGAISTFLPWASMPIVGSINGTQAGAEGWLNLLLFVGAAWGLLQDDAGGMLKKTRYLAVVIPSAIAGLLGLWKIIDFYMTMSKLSGEMAELGGMMGGFAPTLGVGLYLIVIAAAVTALLVYKYPMVEGWFGKKKK